MSHDDPGVRADLGDVVELVWIDATGERAQLSEHDVLSIALPKVHTYGVLLEDSPTRVVVAGERIVVPGERSYRNATVVPRAVIRHIRLLKAAP
jgi:hypothetical protein